MRPDALTPSDPPLVGSARACMQRALENLSRRQSPDGAWSGDYGGPMFLLPMYVALAYSAGAIPERHRAGFVDHFRNVQGQGDRIGLHAEDPRGSMFATVLGYVAQRLLGVEPDEPRMIRLRAWIHREGSPLGAPSWGKFTLCLLGLYDWSGIHPVLPELWLLPPAVAFHPRRLWCHCRQAYLPMAWLYGRRATTPENALIRALRDEIYGADVYPRIAWAAHRDTIAATDAYRPPNAALRAANGLQDLFEPICPARLRRRAMDRVLDHVRYDDRATQWINLGPVNKVLNGFVHHFNDPGGDDFRRAFAACEPYLWPGHDGTKMQGYNSSKLWDTAFAIQAALAAGAPHSHGSHRAMVERAHGYLCDNQILEDVPDAERYYRHASRGGWPFSNRAHGWPVTDCTAEGLKCALALEGQTATDIPEALLRDALALILSWQNDDGGWATYERQRGGAWLELLNPSQVFGDIMVDYSYVECTSACLQAIARARIRFKETALGERIDQAVRRGARFLRGAQRADGSFEGSWGVCFTYGTWFGVSGLLAAGVAPSDSAIDRACAFLLRKQRADGSWGEHGDSCRERRYIDAPAGGAAQTAWALSTLVRARHASRPAQESAVRWIVARQRPDGAWPREPLVGVFNKTCLINYDNYRHYFPLWAVAEWYATVAEPRFDR
jgi:squalene/oxidosqualene cyclase-like protein